MDQALRLAARGVGRTRPNPAVGCVLVKEGRVVGKGFHPKAGEPHAEIFALRDAGEAARGSTAYVTLEPCSHQGRTPPCADALIEAGVARVVAAMADPNPKVAGRGLKRLEAAGIAVESGLREVEARAVNRGFLTLMEKGRPHVTLKAAASLDGKIATRTGASQWITGPAARSRVHRMRDRHDAVMVGIGTVLADDPQLTARFSGARNPIRVVVDSNLRIPGDCSLIERGAEAPLWIATTVNADPAKKSLLAGHDFIEIITCPETPEGRVDLSALLKTLGDREVTRLLSEAGGRLTQALLDARLADRATLFLAPMLIGGRDAAGILDGGGVVTLAEAPRLKEASLSKLGPDFLIEGDVDYSCSPD